MIRIQFPSPVSSTSVSIAIASLLLVTDQEITPLKFCMYYFFKSNFNTWLSYVTLQDMWPQQFTGLNMPHLAVGIFHATRNRKDLTHKLTVLCDYCSLTPNLATNIFYTYITLYPLILIAVIRHITSTKPPTHFLYISAASGAT
jgi:hypothetical protein